MNLDSIGGRRYLLTWAVMLIDTALCWYVKIPADTWASVLQWSVGFYIVGNVAQRHIENRPQVKETT